MIDVYGKHLSSECLPVEFLISRLAVYQQEYKEVDENNQQISLLCELDELTYKISRLMPG